MNKRRKRPKQFPFKLKEPVSYTGTIEDSFELNLLGFDNNVPVLTIIKDEKLPVNKNTKVNDDDFKLNVKQPLKCYLNKKKKSQSLIHDHNYTTSTGPSLFFKKHYKTRVSSQPPIQETGTVVETRKDEEGNCTNEFGNLFKNYDKVTVEKSNIWKKNLFRELQSCCQFDAFGNIPLHTMVLNNNLSAVIRQCLVLRMRNIDISIRNYQSLNAFQLAVVHDCSYEILYVLIKFNINTLVVDNEGNTALHLAVLHSEATTLQAVLAYAKIDLNTVNLDGDTALILCVTYEKFQHAEFLLSAGADPNIADRRSGRTPLFHAIEANNPNMVQLLLQYNGFTKIRNFSGLSPHDAVFELDSICEDIKNLILKRSCNRDTARKCNDINV